MTTLLVLGGADGALGTLRLARTLGVHTICADARADAPGAAVADELLNVSTLAVPALVAALRGRRVDGVVSPASDVNLPSQYALATRLGLPCGLSEEAVRASVDKGYFRSVCDGLGLPGPRWWQGPHGQARRGLRDAGVPWPLMVKPTDSSGSRGITRVAEPAGLGPALAEAAAFSRRDVVIVEEYLTGRHFTAEAVVVDGRIAATGVTERRLTDPPYFVTTEHWMPGGEQTEDLAERARPVLDELCAALGYRWGALNADLLLTPDGRLVVGEWGARTGGNGVAELLGLAYGVDATEVYVRMALGERVEVSAEPRGHAAFRVLGAPVEGKLVGVDGVEAARAVPGIADVVVAAALGDAVVPYTRAGAKLGYLLASGPGRAAVARSLSAAESALRFDIEPDA
ncbi:ATP-grasp domain-containing protein [Dactylosporangium sp. CA-052675]|uniref:ATP-grasp domain-containing protein n=1 Tax=Dactylosporangium sp. CA-052675 TaxID=3239927 RepID=UPI003D8AD8A4